MSKGSDLIVFETCFSKPSDKRTVYFFNNIFHQYTRTHSL